MRLRLDMPINGRRLRLVTAAAMLTACASTQANEVPGYGFESAAQEITQLQIQVVDELAWPGAYFRTMFAK